MTDTEKETLCERAAVLIKSDPRIFRVDFSSETLTMMIAQLQLAFRHPLNTGAGRETMESVARTLIRQLDPDCGEVWQLLMMGFEAEFGDFIEED